MSAGFCKDRRRYFLFVWVLNGGGLDLRQVKYKRGNICQAVWSISAEGCSQLSGSSGRGASKPAFIRVNFLFLLFASALLTKAGTVCVCMIDSCVIVAVSGNSRQSNGRFHVHQNP